MSVIKQQKAAIFYTKKMLEENCVFLFRFFFFFKCMSLNSQYIQLSCPL